MAETEPTQPDAAEHAAVRRNLRARLAELDRVWTPERWEQARRELAEKLNAAA